VRLYRVFYYVAGAAERDPGGVFFIPRQGRGRIDNPASYETLYVGDSRAGVCAEAFNRGKYRRQWSADMLRGLPILPGSVRAMAWYEFEDKKTQICNLDDPRELLARKLRPSLVATRDYSVSQTWALALFKQRRWSGARWWSYHDARWASFGLWKHRAIAHGVEQLTIDNADLRLAADVLKIRVVGTHRAVAINR
jgi:hypothetical protein